MISENSFSKEWIDELRNLKDYKKSHPELMEKMIYALYLTEMLVKEGLDFTFKGGTCLTLLMPEIKRFSIDVDITTEIEINTLEEVLKRVVNTSRFTRFMIDSRRSFQDGHLKTNLTNFLVARDVFNHSYPNQSTACLMPSKIHQSQPYWQQSC